MIFKPKPIYADLDFKQIALECQLLCVGDWHEGYSVKRELVRILPDLKRAGVSFIAFELLHADMQPELDFYQKLAVKANSPERQRLLKHFIEIWGNEEDPDERNMLASMAEQFVCMIDSMAENDIRVIGIEPPVPRMFAETTRNANPNWADGLAELRTESWASAIEKVLTGPSKALVFAGFRHFGYKSNALSQPKTFNEHMTDLGFVSRVIQYAGGDFPIESFEEETRAYGKPESIGQCITEWALQEKLDSKKFYVSLHDSDCRDGDYVIHLPHEPSVFNA